MVRIVLILLMSWSYTAQGQFNRALLTRSTASAPSSYDADAQSYFTHLQAVGFTPTETDKQQVNDYIVELKAGGVWETIVARYLLFWGNDAANGVSLKAGVPNVVWSATGITHLPNGVQNSTSGHGKTGLIPSQVLTLNSSHIVVYSQTDLQSGNADIGVRSIAATSNLLMVIRSTANVLSNQQYSSTGSGYTPFTNTNGTGYYIGTRRTSASNAMFKNGVKLGVAGTASSATLPTHEFYICGWNNAGAAASATGRIYSLQGFGHAMSDQAAAADNTATEKLMDARGIGVQ